MDQGSHTFTLAGNVTDFDIFRLGEKPTAMIAISLPITRSNHSLRPSMKFKLMDI